MYDVVILATKRNISVLQISLPYIYKNLDSDNVYIIANRRDFGALSKLQAHIIDEETILEGMTFERITDLIEKKCGERKRAGWYLQQFIKMAWSFNTNKDYYVVFDADTIPLQHIDYLSKEGKYLLTQKREYHKPYFKTIDVLFHGELGREADGSFIAENMVIDTKIMRQLIGDIEKNTTIKGDSFYEKIINAIDARDILWSGFSEFETYGNYIYKNFPDIVELRKLRTLREAMQIISSSPTEGQLEWAAKEYEIISIESSDYKRTVLTGMTGNALFRRMFKMSTINRLRTNLRTVYRKITKKQDMVFD